MWGIILSIDYETVANWATIVVPVGAIITAITAIIALKQHSKQLALSRKIQKETVEYSRKKYAVDLLQEWNAQTTVHRKVIETSFPRLFDVTHEAITEDKCVKICASTPGFHPEWECHFALMQILNYFEFVSIAYTEKVAEPGIIKESMQGTMVKWYQKILMQYIKVVHENRKYNPWRPYVKLMEEWQKEMEPSFQLVPTNE